jgi:hypothetical protein
MYVYADMYARTVTNVFKLLTAMIDKNLIAGSSLVVAYFPRFDRQQLDVDDEQFKQLKAFVIHACVAKILEVMHERYVRLFSLALSFALSCSLALLLSLALSLSVFCIRVCVCVCVNPQQRLASRSKGSRLGT